MKAEKRIQVPSGIIGLSQEKTSPPSRSPLSPWKNPPWERSGAKILDPLICPECSGPKRLISFIEEEDIIRKILEHLKLWKEREPRPPPAVPEQVDIQYVPFFDS